MSSDRLAIIAASQQGIMTALRLKQELAACGTTEVALFSPRAGAESTRISSITEWTAEEFHNWDALVYIGALGICVRAVAPVLQSKKSDPAVINCDEQGRFVQSVLSGHYGGANDLARRVSRMLGAQPVITTSSDVQGLWPLDILGRDEGWGAEYRAGLGGRSLTDAQAAFVNHEPTVLLLDVRDELTDRLERTCPDFVTVAYRYEDVDVESCSLLLAVTPFLYEPPVQAVFYRPRVLCVGLGSEKGIDPERFVGSFLHRLREKRLSYQSVTAFATVDFKAQEPAFQTLTRELGIGLHGYDAQALEAVGGVPNPSETVFHKVGIHSVSEAASALLAGHEEWIVEKQKVALDDVEKGQPRHFTFAVSMKQDALRRGHISIVGAGPGDPGLVTVRGRELIEAADLVLYAGSLVPEKLTEYAHAGALVRSSASMSLEEQFELMKRFCLQGKQVVRLHTGDPCIYGAIQEQITWFEAHEMPYDIVPGVSSFQAAAAALNSQFTVPEKVQTIILTRGNGRTPVPEKERLRDLARARATMCIFLSAEWADQVQRELEAEYPPTTPVAVCYRLSWDDQQVWRGELGSLAAMVRESGKTRTVLLVVGEAIGARQNRSKLYDPHFTHGFRRSAREE
ncbi:precorrin-4 C(11)-methyltransferase [Prosthecochloris sp. ZM]|uniref:precorrin-4 C(11)-methyltransferase n=1 Tax=Prosthecochloris sp. ZM TaxID=2283143 RepID=UPI000DF7E24F|nr:precorrin-4 C(11)-methyltransferase [Prosthecochloris sp. ZM]RDD30156.1 precorrin-4 C(11)-methyltransferase [Prosthecochloris sp. ZM]